MRGRSKGSSGSENIYERDGQVVEWKEVEVVWENRGFEGKALWWCRYNYTLIHHIMFINNYNVSLINGYLTNQ